MATKTLNRRQTLKSGPWSSVFSTNDPYDGEEDILVGAKNVYALDPTDKAGIGSRPGFRRLFGGAIVAAPLRGQLVYTHTDLDASTIGFIISGGKIFRVDASLSTATDVTPVGVAISASITTRVFGASSIGQLLFTDGVNRPWIATNLTSTPIIGTYIDYDGMGVDWTIHGKPWVYGGSAFGILNQVNSVARRADVSWCKPGNFSLGWQQADYDFNWTLSQNQAGALYCLQADNVSLRYFREGSIGAITGTVGPDLKSTATNDAVAFNIGSQAPQSIVEFGNGFFFCDAQGRPYWFEPGVAPVAIWKQMRADVDVATTNYPTTTSITCTATIDPTNNLYLVAIWSPDPNIESPPTAIHVFDALTRKYQGIWDIQVDGVAIGIECLGTLVDSAGRATVIVLAEGGECWAMNALGSTPENLATMDGVFEATMDGVDLVTMGQSQIWTDDGGIPDIELTTDYLGFDENTIWNVDQGVIVTLNDTPVRVTIGTAAVRQTLEGIPQPAASQDGTYRLPFGCDIMGRGPVVVVKPLTADTQWVCERISLTAIPSLAGPEDS